MEPYYQTTDAQ